jgi:hypothetical protein
MRVRTQSAGIVNPYRPRATTSKGDDHVERAGRYVLDLSPAQGRASSSGEAHGNRKTCLEITTKHRHCLIGAAVGRVGRSDIRDYGNSIYVKTECT